MKQYKITPPLYSRCTMTLLLLLGIGLSGYSQSIRKNFNEMTVSERDALVSALNTVGGMDGTSGIIDMQSTFHATNFCNIHFNNLVGSQDCGLGNDIANDVFTAWHRQNSLAVEQVLQGIADWVSLPYWDWTGDADDEDNGPMGSGTLSPLWTGAWLGGFDTPWNLGREFDDNVTLPSAADVATLQATSSFDQYTTNLENGFIHTGAHAYVGGDSGIMSNSRSPKDPVFYFHHNMVDKIWQEWERANPGGSSFQLTSIPGFTSVDPNSLVDSRTIGVFYADSGLAVLDNYDVANLVLSNEKFVYQFVIEAGNQFGIPNGKVSEFRSCNEIVLKDGFRAYHGSEFLATIDGDCDFSTAFKVDPALTYVDTFNAPVLRPEEIIYNAYRVNSSQSLIAASSSLQIYPNPANDMAKLEIELPNAKQVSFTLVDAVGRTVKRWNANLPKGVSTIDFDASKMSSGLYYLSMNVDDHLITEKILIQH